mgnify:CR=1 FL=1
MRSVRVELDADKQILAARKIVRVVDSARVAATPDDRGAFCAQRLGRARQMEMVRGAPRSSRFLGVMSAGMACVQIR